MPIQIRTIVLATATVAVLGALLVLFFQVRSAPELEVPEEALSQARAQYERSQSQRAPETYQADRGVAPARPPRRPPTSDLAAAGSDGERPRPPPALRRSVSNVRSAAGSPATRAARQASQDAKEPVRAAYDQGDFSTALELAEKYLNEFPGDGYVQRVAGVSACAMGEEAIARKYHALMSATDQSIVGRRCARYGIELQR